MLFLVIVGAVILIVLSKKGLLRRKPDSVKQAEWDASQARRRAVQQGKAQRWQARRDWFARVNQRATERRSREVGDDRFGAVRQGGRSGKFVDGKFVPDPEDPWYRGLPDA
jgi:hypothetical protein